MSSPFNDFKDWFLSQSTIQTLLNTTGPGATGIIPVFPAGEQPETEFPYIRYGISTQNDAETFWHVTDDLVLTVFHENYDSLQQIMNFFRESCERGSESAEIINTWMEANGRDDYIFTSFEVRLIGQAFPPGEEGGAFMRQITIRYMYLVR